MIFVEIRVRIFFFLIHTYKYLIGWDRKNRFLLFPQNNSRFISESIFSKIKLTYLQLNPNHLKCFSQKYFIHYLQINLFLKNKKSNYRKMDVFFSIK